MQVFGQGHVSLIKTISNNYYSNGLFFRHYLIVIEEIETQKPYQLLEANKVQKHLTIKAVNILSHYEISDKFFI